LEPPLRPGAKVIDEVGVPPGPPEWTQCPDMRMVLGSISQPVQMKSPPWVEDELADGPARVQRRVEDLLPAVGADDGLAAPRRGRALGDRRGRRRGQPGFGPGAGVGRPHAAAADGGGLGARVVDDLEEQGIVGGRLTTGRAGGQQGDQCAHRRQQEHHPLRPTSHHDLTSRESIRGTGQ